MDWFGNNGNGGRGTLAPFVAMLATCVVAALIIAAPATAAPATTTPANGTPTATPTNATPANAAIGEDASASERRAANSEFEREKLDQEAFGGGAAQDADAEETGSEESGSGGGSALRAMFGLVIVLALMFGIHWLLKKWGQSKLQGMAGAAGIIDVVATTPLAQGRTLHLVRVGPELVLVGATDQSITRIGEVDGDTFQSNVGNAGRGEFQAMLSGAMHGQQPGVPNTGAANQPFLKRFLENLRMTTAR